MLQEISFLLFADNYLVFYAWFGILKLYSKLVICLTLLQALQLEYITAFLWTIAKWLSCQYFAVNVAKGRISKRVFQESKHAKFFEKRTFLSPSYAQVLS